MAHTQRANYPLTNETLKKRKHDCCKLKESIGHSEWPWGARDLSIHGQELGFSKAVHGIWAVEGFQKGLLHLRVLVAINPFKPEVSSPKKCAEPLLKMTSQSSVSTFFHRVTSPVEETTSVGLSHANTLFIQLHCNCLRLHSTSFSCGSLSAKPSSCSDTVCSCVLTSACCYPVDLQSRYLLPLSLSRSAVRQTHTHTHT